MFFRERVEIFVLAKRGMILRDNLSCVFARGALRVDFVERVGAIYARIPPHPFRQRTEIIFLRGQRLPILIHAVIRKIQRAIVSEIVKRNPSAIEQNILTPQRRERANQIHFAAAGHGGQAGIAARFQNKARVKQPIQRDEFRAFFVIAGYGVLFPFGGIVGFVVGFKIQYADINQFANGQFFARGNVTGIGFGRIVRRQIATHDAHKRKNSRVQ